MDHDRLFKDCSRSSSSSFWNCFFPSSSSDGDSVEFLDKEVFTDVTEGEAVELATKFIQFGYKNSSAFSACA
jgi:hypothetical protein